MLSDTMSASSERITKSLDDLSTVKLKGTDYYRKSELQLLLGKGTSRYSDSRFIITHKIDPHEHVYATLVEGKWKIVIVDKNEKKTMKNVLFITKEAAEGIMELEAPKQKRRAARARKASGSKASAKKAPVKKMKGTKMTRIDRPNTKEDSTATDDEDYVVEEDLCEIDEDDCQDVELEEVVARKKPKKVIKARLFSGSSDEVEGKPVVPEKGFAKAPPIIHMDEAEMFRDVDNIVVQVQMRGERDIDQCYYLASDIETGYGIERIESLMLDKKSYYCYGEHFEYFMVRKKKVLYLKYFGLTRILYGRNNPNIEKYIRWANNVLFTVRHGTAEAKRRLASELIGIDPRDILKIYTKKNGKRRKAIPCIYFFLIGENEIADRFGKTLKVGERIFKYGMTIDLAQRIEDHLVTYGNMEGSTFRLVYFKYIDPTKVSEAEKEVKDYFIATKARFTVKKSMLVKGSKGEDELVILHKDNIDAVYAEYDKIAERYQEKITELQRQVGVITSAMQLNTETAKKSHLAILLKTTTKYEKSLKLKDQEWKETIKELREEHKETVKELKEEHKETVKELKEEHKETVKLYKKMLDGEEAKVRALEAELKKLRKKLI